MRQMKIRKARIAMEKAIADPWAESRASQANQATNSKNFIAAIRLVQIHAIGLVKGAGQRSSGLEIAHQARGKHNRRLGEWHFVGLLSGECLWHPQPDRGVIGGVQLGVQREWKRLHLWAAIRSVNEQIDDRRGLTQLDAWRRPARRAMVKATLLFRH